MTNITGLVATVYVGVYFGVNMLHVPNFEGVAQLCERHGINQMRIHEVSQPLLRALENKHVKCTLDIPNRLLQKMKDNSTIDEWYDKFVKTYSNTTTVEYIAVGEDGHPKILRTMQRLRDLLEDFNNNNVKLTTVINYRTCLISKDLPSTGTFHPFRRDNIEDILKFLVEDHRRSGSSILMVNMYPYQKYVYDNNGAISLDYATFEGKNSVIDGKYIYDNLFDAMVDTVYEAIKKLEGKGLENVRLWIGETGWPTNGHGDATSFDLARKYNSNFITHSRSLKGTPRRPNISLPGYIRSLFNEDAITQGDLQYYGIFNNDFTPKYPIFF